MCGQHPKFHLNKKRKRGDYTGVSECGRSSAGSCFNFDLRGFKKQLAICKQETEDGMPKSWVSKPCTVCLKKSGITA